MEPTFEPAFCMECETAECHAMTKYDDDEGIYVRVMWCQNGHVCVFDSHTGMHELVHVFPG